MAILCIGQETVGGLLWRVITDTYEYDSDADAAAFGGDKR